jgi:hypothetical protein
MYNMGDAAKACRGKIIKSIKVENDELTIDFRDGVTLTLWDDASYCCERRYMTCDDELHYWEGLAFIGYCVANGPDLSDDNYEQHDCQFLIVDTFLGSFTVANHNEHNGYYGGFSVAEKLTPELPEKVTEDADD